MITRLIRLGGVALVILGAPRIGHAQPKPEYSIDKFYSLPSLIGTEPRGMNWSPDGRTVAFLWNDEGMPFLDVFVARVAPGQSLTPERVTRLPRPDIPASPPDPYGAQRSAITAELDEGVRSVSWHPDGRRMLYAMQGSLWFVTPGTQPVRLAAPLGAIQRPTFDPAGTRLAFVRDGDLWVATLRGDSLVAPRRLTTLSRAGIGVDDFTWAPDGRTLALIETDRTPIRTRLIPDYLPRRSHGHAGASSHAGRTIRAPPPRIRG